MREKQSRWRDWLRQRLRGKPYIQKVRTRVKKSGGRQSVKNPKRRGASLVPGARERLRLLPGSPPSSPGTKALAPSLDLLSVYPHQLLPTCLQAPFPEVRQFGEGQPAPTLGTIISHVHPQRHTHPCICMCIHTHTRAQVRGSERHGFKPQLAMCCCRTLSKACIYCISNASAMPGTVQLSPTRGQTQTIFTLRRNYHPTGLTHETLRPRVQPLPPHPTYGETEAQRRKRG